jgi:hypothetical protein
MPADDTSNADYDNLTERVAGLDRRRSAISHRVTTVSDAIARPPSGRSTWTSSRRPRPGRSAELLRAHPRLGVRGVTAMDVYEALYTTRMMAA